MKVLYTAAFVLLFHFASNATIWPVAVSNFQFSPATVNAVVGDTIKFDFVAGSFDHTTTCGAGLPGTSLPAGATEWDAALTTASTSFSYKITVAGTYNYGCVPHFSFGMKGTIVASGPLPVKLGSFSVTDDKGRAYFNWKTFSESNVDHFSIRKSTDGSHFSEVGQVKAAGNSDRTLNYTFTDIDSGSMYKYLYYEIAIVDIDKRESFSSIKILRNGSITKDNLIVALGPNPITRPGQVQLTFNADKRGKMGISVYSGSGQLVLKTSMAAFYGLNSGHLHICDLEKGTYHLIFTLGDKMESRKVVVL